MAEATGLTREAVRSTWAAVRLRPIQRLHHPSVDPLWHGRSRVLIGIWSAGDVRALAQAVIHVPEAWSAPVSESSVDSYLIDQARDAAITLTAVLDRLPTVSPGFDQQAVELVTFLTTVADLVPRNARLAVLLDRTGRFMPAAVRHWLTAHADHVDAHYAPGRAAWLALAHRCLTASAIDRTISGPDLATVHAHLLAQTSNPQHHGKALAWVTTEADARAALTLPRSSPARVPSRRRRRGPTDDPIDAWLALRERRAALDDPLPTDHFLTLRHLRRQHIQPTLSADDCCDALVLVHSAWHHLNVLECGYLTHARDNFVPRSRLAQVMRITVRALHARTVRMDRAVTTTACTTSTPTTDSVDPLDATWATASPAHTAGERLVEAWTPPHTDLANPDRELPDAHDPFAVLDYLLTHQLQLDLDTRINQILTAYPLIAWPRHQLPRDELAFYEHGRVHNATYTDLGAPAKLDSRAAHNRHQRLRARYGPTTTTATATATNAAPSRTDAHVYWAPAEREIRAALAALLDPIHREHLAQDAGFASDLDDLQDSSDLTTGKVSELMTLLYFLRDHPLRGSAPITLQNAITAGLAVRDRINQWRSRDVSCGSGSNMDTV